MGKTFTVPDFGPNDLLTTDRIGGRNVKVTEMGVEDGKRAMSTEFGEQAVGMRIDDVSINFHYGLSSRDLKLTESTGTGSISSVGSDAQIECGTGIGKGEMVSIDAVRYRAGHEEMAMITHNQSELQAGVKVKHGLLNVDDGVCVGSNGTVKGLWFIEGGNETFIPQPSFNGDKIDGSGKSGFNWDIENRNLFHITIGYLSIAPIRFYIHTGDTWVLIHSIILANTQTLGHLKNPTLPLACRVERESGSGASVYVQSGSWRAGTIGAEHQVNSSDRVFDLIASRENLASINIVANPDDYHNIFSLTNSTTFNGKDNHIRCEVIVVNFVVDANKSVEFVGVADGALTGNDAFQDVSTGNSVLSYSKGGTVTGEQSGAATVLGKTSDRRTNVRGTGIYIRPDQTFSLGARGINGSSVIGDISASFRWIEEF